MKIVLRGSRGPDIIVAEYWAKDVGHTTIIRGSNISHRYNLGCSGESTIYLLDPYQKIDADEYDEIYLITDVVSGGMIVRKEK